MTPYVSQTIESNRCGAQSIAYYLWETNKSQLVNDKQFVAELHKKIQIGPNDLGLPETFSLPQKMVKELSDSWHSYAYICMLANSPLTPMVKKFNLSTEYINVLDKVKNGDNKYAIMTATFGQDLQKGHYMLIKYENNTFKLLDPLYYFDYVASREHGKVILNEINGMDHVVWENFIPEANWKLTIENRDSLYYYTGFGIVIE
jgi:hypothetical protein